MREFSNVHSACTCARLPHIAEPTGVSPTFSACTYRNRHAHIATYAHDHTSRAMDSGDHNVPADKLLWPATFGLRVDMFDSWTS